MKKTLIALGIVLGILILLGVGGYFAFKYVANTVSSKLQETVGEDIGGVIKDNEDEDDSNGSSSAISTEQCIETCNRMFANNKDINCNDYCNASTGIDKSDPESCEKASGDIRDACYIQIASDLKRADLCEKVSEDTLRYGCYINIVEDTKDKSLCEKIEDESLKAACNAIE